VPADKAFWTSNKPAKRTLPSLSLSLSIYLYNIYIHTGVPGEVNILGDHIMGHFLCRKSVYVHRTVSEIELWMLSPA
jgi:hypothetical protein